MRANSDEAYVIDLCDRVLGRSARRGYRFPFLLGDKGHSLPVDAFYPDLNLVIEYRERQHSETVAFFDNKSTVSDVSRGVQRARYDQRRRDLLPQHGMTLVELDYSDFPHDAQMRLKRTPQDVSVVQNALKAFIVLSEMKSNLADEDPAAPPEPWGHRIDVGGFLRDVVQLMAYINLDVTSIWRKERKTDEPLERFQGIVEHHLMNEIPRLLLSIAATLRTKIDDGSWLVNEEHIGWLSQGERVDPERGESLDVRETCNKIIHANRVHPEESEVSGIKSIGAIVHLRGDRNSVPWSAQVNLREFCIAVANTNFSPHHKGCRS